MARTLAQIQKQIDQLQKEADALRAKEAAGVVERIKVAIAHYGLTAQDLFGASSTGKASKAGRAAKPAVTKAAPKPPSPPKFRDDAGHTWTGVGKRPRWYTEALAAGKTPQDLMVKAEA